MLCFFLLQIFRLHLNHLCPRSLTRRVVVVVFVLVFVVLVVVVVIVVFVIVIVVLVVVIVVLIVIVMVVRGVLLFSSLLLLSSLLLSSLLLLFSFVNEIVVDLGVPVVSTPSSFYHPVGFFMMGATLGDEGNPFLMPMQLELSIFNEFDFTEMS